MRAAALFRDLAIARADGSLRSLLVRFSRIDVLVIDDWAMAPLAESERRDFWEICEDRYQARSTILIRGEGVNGSNRFTIPLIPLALIIGLDPQTRRTPYELQKEKILTGVVSLSSRRSNKHNQGE
jgi:hypothetical protein